MIRLNIPLVVFMAGYLPDMGLKQNPTRHSKDCSMWGFVIGPALAYAIEFIIPPETPYTPGLILMVMATSAPFLSILAGKK